MDITYRPGGWFGVVGEQLLVMLPPGSKRRAISVWEVVDEGAGFDQVLDMVIAQGLRDLPGLVVIGTTGDSVRVLVRGSATATLDTAQGRITVDGAAAWTWAERTLSGVTSLSVLLEHAGVTYEGEHFAVDRGLVRLGSLTHPAGVVQPERAGDLEDTAAVASAGELTEAVALAPVAPVAAVAAAHPPGAHPVLLLSTGEELEVDRPLIVGRAPVARRIFSDDEPRLVTVPSPAHEISSTHLEIRPSPDGKAVVTDLGSTNGTVLVQPGVAPEDLRPGYPVSLVKGAIIDLGDGVTIKVVS